MNSTVNVGILSDTHGYLDPRIAEVVNQCDYVVHAGDIMGAHVLAQLQPRTGLIAVAGNNDHPALWNREEAEVVAALPEITDLVLPGGTVRIEHGHRLGGFPDHAQLRWDHADVKLVIYGHTHKRIIDQQAEPWILNPGAAGRERTKGGPSCVVLAASATEWKFETVLFADAEAD